MSAGSRLLNVFWNVGILATVIWLGQAMLLAAGSGSPQAPGKRPAVAATRPASSAATRPGEYGPDVVVLRELVNLYDPVPFDHRGHAQMAEMWQGCVTCHHRSPAPTTQPAAASPAEHRAQSDSSAIPACKSCHEASTAEESGDIAMPNLKGAYHRQCLNCHREWMHENACGICHQPRNGVNPLAATPTKDDVIGRMHPPIPEPEIRIYRARFTPADGRNVMFRHRQHVHGYDMKCVSCHHRDTCSNCHDAQSGVRKEALLKPGRTWADSHGPCMGCHEGDRCRHCHYKDDQQPPPPFDHARTGQLLDKDHQHLKCGQCHLSYKTTANLSCGDASCHKDPAAVIFPAKRPGPVVPARPAADVAMEEQAAPTRGMGR